MPKLHDFRADFRAGRTGDALRVREDTDAYRASVYDAENMMITAENQMFRRWGTLDRFALTGDTRLWAWEFSQASAEQFLMLFSDARLDIYDMTLTLRQSFTTQPWTTETMRFMTLASEGTRVVISDETFRTRFLTLDPEAGTFTMSEFDFDLSDDETRLFAPFFRFVAESVEMTLTIHTAAGTSTGYGAYIATASGISASDFDLAAGTGKATTSADFFVADHVGTRMRLADGEIEILSVVDAQNATIKVWRDVAVSLDTDPFFFRNGSDLTEVAAADHGLKVGDEVFFTGLSSVSGDWSTVRLTNAVPFASSPTTATAPSGGAATYTVLRILDANHFEVQANSASSVDALAGGSDVKMYKFDGIKNIREPAFSEARGWPQACAVQNQRLWLGGTRFLPDAVWASRPNRFEDFDTGDGAADDAIQMYGIGSQSRVRHIIPGFDTIILTDSGTHYVPGSPDIALTQENARTIPGPEHGSSYTTPVNFDGSVFFVDVLGQHVRELVVSENENAGYVSNPATVVAPDWVRGPDETAGYKGSPNEATPYVLFVNSEDGSLLVMHSRRNDQAFGFMLWKLEGGEFISAAGVDNRLFAVAKYGTDYSLVEFHTDANYVTTDFSAILTGTAETNWTSARHASETVQVYAPDGRVFSDATLDVSGNFTTSEALDEVRIGFDMPWFSELHTPIAGSGQGTKSGKMKRLVSAEVNWRNTITGTVSGENALEALDQPALSAPIPVDEWREYYPGEWGREPRLKIEGDTPGHVAMRGVVLNVYF